MTLASLFVQKDNGSEPREKEALQEICRIQAKGHSTTTTIACCFPNLKSDNLTRKRMAVGKD